MIPAAPASAGLDARFAPRSIAVVGASTRPGKLGAVMARSLRDFGDEVALVGSPTRSASCSPRPAWG